MNIAADQIIGEPERVGILDDLIAVTYHAENTAVAVPHICFEAFDHTAAGIINAFLPDGPIQSRKPKGILAVGRFGYLRPQAVPGPFSYIHHRFHICCHFESFFPEKFTGNARDTRDRRSVSGVIMIICHSDFVLFRVMSVCAGSLLKRGVEARGRHPKRDACRIFYDIVGI